MDDTSAAELFEELHQLLYADWVGDGRPMQDETLHRDLLATYRKRFRKRALAAYDRNPDATGYDRELIDDPQDGHDVVRVTDVVRRIGEVEDA